MVGNSLFYKEPVIKGLLAFRYNVCDGRLVLLPRKHGVAKVSNKPLGGGRVRKLLQAVFIPLSKQTDS